MPHVREDARFADAVALAAAALGAAIVIANLPALSTTDNAAMDAYRARLCEWAQYRALFR